jgi:inorganic pyrophosphatase
MANLAALDPALDLHARTCAAVVECSRGERCKFAYDPARECFELKRLLPAGMSFPLDFGFIPSTRAEDGDPLDIMLINDVPLPMGVVCPVRLVGVIEADQTEDGKTVRNDRLLGVATCSLQFSGVQTYDDLGDAFLETLTEFWTHYERLRGVGFKVLTLADGGEAAKRVRDLSVEGSR